MVSVPTPSWPPEPPVPLPPARTLVAPGRGELFLRDTGGDGPVVMLLHGWMASADLNWSRAYGDLQRAGYRVLAIDHRGHGRGLRPLTPFRLADCATDAAAALRELDAAPAVVVGYSMGGAIAQLVARNHPDVVSGLVLSGTAMEWQDPRTRNFWRAMTGLGLVLAVAPRAAWRWSFKRVGIRESPASAWLASELTRNSASDIAEAGRESNRPSSRPWVSSLSMPSAVVVTSKDTAVSPRKQRALAAALGAHVVEVPIEHLGVTAAARKYNPALLEAIDAVRTGERAQAA
jgi:pimeloyl-ACP methyl ester carboxylesterase